jgi:hypothetical protein
MSVIRRSPAEESILLPPVVFELDGCKVYIYNVIATTNVRGDRRYIVTAQVECYGVFSKQACFDVSNEPELMSILKKEIALFKSIVLSGAYNAYARG